MARWLEIAAHYGCNNQCVGCFSVSTDGPSMTSAEVLETLRYGRAQGATWLWLGGGEPTLRRDVFATVAAARKLGYTRVKLQTNGMMLAYPEFTRRCVEAGVTEINFSLKGASAESHDRLTRTAGCYELLMKGLAQWKQTGLPCEGDVLVYQSNVDELPTIVKHYHSHGVDRFNLWMFSPAAQGGEDKSAEMPRITDVVARIREILALRLTDQPGFISSLHTPACTLLGGAESSLFSAAELDMIVANPGGHRFWLEESPIEGGVFAERCSSCSARARCGGFRAEYSARFGDAEFQPLR